MAFVFKSPKDLDKPIEKEYDILTSKRIHKIKKNVLKKNNTNKNKLLSNIIIKPPIPRKHSAFGINEKRDFLHLKNKQNFPGPGAYNINDNYIKKSFNKVITSVGNNENNNGNDIFDFEKNKLKLFISKEERFKNNNKNNESPGPGEYNIMNLPNIKKNAFNKSNEVIKSRIYLNNSPFREISIPSRGNNYGYFIDEKGEKQLEQDPHLILNKRNNLGPGSYDIKAPNWNKNNMLDWSKISSRNKQDKNYKESREEIINNIYLLIDELNRNKIRDKLLNNITTEPTNFSNNSGISILNSKDTNKIISYTLREEDSNKNINNKIKYDKKKEINDDRESSTNIDNNNNYSNNENLSKSSELKYNDLKIIYDDYHNKNILKQYLRSKPQIPGPGNYSLLDQFENLANCKKSDNFGSSLSRGLIYPKTKNKIKIGHQKRDKNLIIYSSFDDNNFSNNNLIKDNKYKVFETNLSNKNVLFRNKSVKNPVLLLKLKNDNSKNNLKLKTEEKEDKDKNNNINYNNEKTNDFPDEIFNRKIINSCSNIENFGSLEKRFYEKPIKEITPGVGAYSIANTQENKKNKYLNISPYKNVIHNLKNYYKMPEILRKKIYNLNHKSPPVGLYSPEVINCIEYDSNKKSCQNNGRKIAFNNEEKRFFKLDNQKYFSNGVGKYNIIKEDKEMIQQKAPFNSSDELKKDINVLYHNEGNNNDINLGPGAYRYDSYFDWIIKSYNKSFN